MAGSAAMLILFISAKLGLLPASGTPMNSAHVMAMWKGTRWRAISPQSTLGYADMVAEATLQDHMQHPNPGQSPYCTTMG